MSLFIYAKEGSADKAVARSLKLHWKKVLNYMGCITFFDTSDLWDEGKLAGKLIMVSWMKVSVELW